MKEVFRLTSIIPFLIAIVVATVWGSIVQTQYNLAALSSVGTDIPGAVRLSATLSDIFSGFSPTYASHIVLPSLLVAFIVAALIPARDRSARLAWFAAAGTFAIALGIPIVNWLAPVALLVGATRELSCLVVMALGGLLAGLVFASLAYPRAPRTRIEDHRAAPGSVPT
jgi:hypothetical protein